MTQIIGTPILSVNRNTDRLPTDNIGMSIGSRIREARRAAKLTQKALALKVGMAQASLSELETGESQGTTLGATIAAALGVSALWLETGRGTMTGADAETEAIEDGNPFITDDVPAPASGGITIGVGEPTIGVRVMSVAVRGGVSGHSEEPEFGEDGLLDVPVRVITELSLDPDELMVFRVKKDSMDPMMRHNDKVLVNKAKRAIIPKHKECYVINWNGEAIVKMLLKKGANWYLHSINPDYGDINVRSGQCSIVGHVVWQPDRILTGK